MATNLYLLLLELLVRGGAMRIFRILLVLILCFSIQAIADGYREGHGDFPHGNVYLVNPEVDEGTTEVELRVDKTGFLKGPYVHVQMEYRSGGNRGRKEVSVKDVSVPQATVYYHAHKGYEFLIKNGFERFKGSLHIVLSQRKVLPLSIRPEYNTIFFGKKGLSKHTLDADIISGAVARLFVMKALGLSSRDKLPMENKAILFGISYYLACAVSDRPVFASSVKNLNISRVNPDGMRSNEENLSLLLASVLWSIGESTSVSLTTELVINAIPFLEKGSSINDLMLNLIQSDFEINDGDNIRLIYEIFDDAGLARRVR